MSPKKTHPKCEICKKALYRTKSKTIKPKDGDEYKWCRNPFCKSQEKRKHTESKIEPNESKSVSLIREQVKKKLSSEESLNFLLLAAITLQELSFQDCANEIIEIYNLHKIYGLEKNECK